MRAKGRADDSIRDVRIETGWIKTAHGSALIEVGDTRLVCTATVEEKVPPFLAGGDVGWVTAEYGMLPASTKSRRENSRTKQDGRAQEIQRLIGRSLRTIVDTKKLGPRTVWIDCDVIQADGGTRTAAITGSFIALQHAIKKLLDKSVIASSPILDSVAAVSVGIVKGKALLDLDYPEDSSAEVDMNVVMTGAGNFVEIQGTGEKAAFGDDDLAKLIALAKKGIADFMAIQRKHLA